MAVIGLRKFKGAKLTETNGVATYHDGKTIAKIIKASLSVSSNDVKCYGDDVVIEVDTSFNGGTCNIGIDEIDATNSVFLLGHAYNDTTKEETSKSSDAAPYLGIGWINKISKAGARSYRATLLTKVVFAEPSEDYETKGENTTFQTPTLPGTIMQRDDEVWRIRMYAATEAACETWLNTQLNIV